MEGFKLRNRRVQICQILITVLFMLFLEPVSPEVNGVEFTACLLCPGKKAPSENESIQHFMPPKLLTTFKVQGNPLLS